jgi:hypothetical protein
MNYKPLPIDIKLSLSHGVSTNSVYINLDGLKDFNRFRASNPAESEERTSPFVLSSVLLKDDAPWRIQRSGKIQGPIDYLGLFSPINPFGSAFLNLLSRVKGKQSGSRYAPSFINLNPLR